MVGLIGQQLLGVTTWKLCLCRTISYVKTLLTSCINWKCAYQTAYRPRWKNPPCQRRRRWLMRQPTILLKNLNLCWPTILLHKTRNPLRQNWNFAKNIIIDCRSKMFQRLRDYQTTLSYQRNKQKASRTIKD